MASIDKFVSSNKLKTYGKSSRNQTFTSAPNLQRPTPNQPRDSFVPHGKDPGIAEESRAHKHEQRQRQPRSPKSHHATHPLKPPTRSPAPATKCDASVFDVPSSDDDERHTGSEMQRKRRKLSVPAAMPVRTKRKEVDDAPVPERRRAQNATPSRPPSRSENRGVKSSSRTKLDSHKVEVIVKTPRTVKSAWDSVPTTTTTQKQERSAPSKQNGTVSPATTSEVRASRESSVGFKGTPSSVDDEQAPPTTKQKRKTSPCAGDSPANKLRRMTERLASPSKPGRMDDRHAKNRASTFGLHATRPTDGRKPGTPSRTRLVDALGGRQDDLSSESSDASDCNVSSVSGREGRRTPSPTRSKTSPYPSRSQRPDSSQTSSLGEHHVSSQTQEAPAHHRGAPATSQKVTYARQRSFLTEADLVEGNAKVDPLKQLASSSLTSDYGVKGKKDRKKPGKHTQLSKKKSSQAFEIDDDDEEDNATGVRSIYELRRAGSNARHQGFTETIFDDLEDEAPLSCKWTSLFQLCSKLSEYQFAQRFLSSSLEQRLAKCTKDLTDIISRFLLACIYALLMSTTPASPIVLQTCSTQMSSIAPALLDEERDIMDIAKQRTLKMTKDALNMLRDVTVNVRAGKIWAEQKPSILSPQIVALRGLELTIRRVRETGGNTTPITTPVLRQLVDLLLQESSATRDAGIQDDDGDATGPENCLVLELGFSILESYTVGLDQLGRSQEAILRGLSQVVGPLLAERASRCGPLGRQIQGLEIRLILNLTNNNSRLSENFSTPELVQGLTTIVLRDFGSVAEELAVSEKKESVLDTVILALGALINLAEWSGAARRLILESSGIGGGWTTNLLDGLIMLFREGWEAAAEANSVVQTHGNVVFGYLSVLLSTLSLDEEIRSRVRASLPGRTLDRLLSTVEEFLHYHRKVDDEIRDVQREEDAMAGFTTRLQGIVDRIRDT